MNKELKGIAVAGSILVDEINHISTYPRVGTLSRINKVESSVGGLVSNDGINIKKINPEIPVYAYGKIGGDEKGKYVIDTFNKAGIVTSNIRTDDESKTSFTQVMSVDGGERTFFTYPGASGKFGYDDIDFDNISAGIFHLGYFLLLEKIDNGDGEEILKRLKESGIETSIDLISSASGGYERVLPCLKYVDYLIVNEIEASGLCGTENCHDLQILAKKLKELGVIKKVIIHKEDKACVYDGGSYLELNSLEIPAREIKGKTGAGDAFCSGCLTEIYRGGTNEEILDFGIRAAAVSLSSANATDGIKTKKEIIKKTNRYDRKK